MKGMLVVFLLTSACAHAQEGVQNILSLDMSPVKEKILIGEPCFVNITLKNTSDHDVTVWMGYLFQYKVRDADNKLAHIRETRALECTRQFILKPGESCYHKENILWDNNTVGEYRISAEYEDDELKMSSNIVKVAIQEPERIEDRKALNALRKIRQEHDNKEWYYIWYDKRISKGKLFEDHKDSIYWKYLYYFLINHASTSESLAEILDAGKGMKDNPIHDLIDLEIARQYCAFGTHEEYGKQLTNILNTYPNSYVAQEATKRKREHDEYLKSREKRKK